MDSFIGGSFMGRLIYHLSSHKYFSYPEEDVNYVVPEKYHAAEFTHSLSSTINENVKVEGDEKTNDVDLKIIIVESDDLFPIHWPLYLKCIFIFEIAFLTVSVYMASAIYTPGIEAIKQDFGIGTIAATLPLSLFVIGYGIGPMILSPMSENPFLGRTSIYIITLLIFFVLQIPIALSKSIVDLSILRFFAGFFASPALATGGASVAEVLALPYIPVGIAIWALAAVCGPSLGPLIGSVLTVKGGWRWTFWFICIISGVCLITLAWLLPETYESTLLTRKAKRLRKVTGNENIKSQAELDNEKMTMKELAIETLYRPFEVTIIEPVVLLINVFIALVYSIMYLWFEAFPIVFVETKGFTLVELGVSYVSIMIGIGIAAMGYIYWTNKNFTQVLLKGNMPVPEIFIPVAIIGSVLMPIGIFIFAWSASENLHWIGPLIGAAIFAAGAFLIFQTLFNYILTSFKPEFMASIFASNDFFRSVSAGVFPLIAGFLFNNTGSEKFPVGWGSSILGFICLAMIAIPVLFYLNGPKLRARSKYAFH